MTYRILKMPTYYVFQFKIWERHEKNNITNWKPIFVFAYTRVLSILNSGLDSVETKISIYMVATPGAPAGLPDTGLGSRGPDWGPFHKKKSRAFFTFPTFFYHRFFLKFQKQNFVGKFLVACFWMSSKMLSYIKKPT